jgi:hypothetical protein
MLWPVVSDEEATNSTGPDWLANLPGKVGPNSAAQHYSGRHGVTRPPEGGPERRSQRRCEPLILGIARGANPLSGLINAQEEAKPRVVAKGRPRDDDALSLIAIPPLDCGESDRRSSGVRA